MAQPWAKLARVAAAAAAVSLAFHASAETATASANLDMHYQEPPVTIPKEAVGLVAVLLLMLLITVGLYVKLRAAAPKAASAGTQPVMLPPSASQAPPIVTIEVDKRPPNASTTGDAPLGSHAMFAADAKSVPDRMMPSSAGEDAVDGFKHADQVESRKSSDPAERCFRKFRLHSLSDGDLSLHILDAHAYEDPASSRP